MKAMTVVPGKIDSAQVEEVAGAAGVRRLGARHRAVRRRLRHRRRDRQGRVRVGAAGHRPADPVPRVARPGRGGACRTRALPRATSWWASCAGPTPYRVPLARMVSGTSATTGSTPSAASRSATGTGRSAGGSSRSTPSSSTPTLGDLGVLLEPTTVVAKAWAQVDAALARVYDPPQRVLVTGAGPDRPAGSADRPAAWPRGARGRPGHRRTQAPAGRGHRGDLPLRRRCTTSA